MTDHHEILVAVLRVVGVLVLALAVRVAVARLIDRLARRAGGPHRPRRLFANARAARVVAATVPWRNERQQQRAQAMASLLKSLATVVISLVAVFMVLDVLGYDLAPLLASAGVVGVALGFGAQNLVKDFLAGVCMLLEDQFGVGDVVDMEKASGQVESVGLRVTRLRDDSGVIWYVRNGEVLRLGNKSQGWSPVSLDLQIAHDEDLYRAADLVNKVTSDVVGTDQFRDAVIEVPTVVSIEPVLKPAGSALDGDQAPGDGEPLTLRVRGTCVTNRQYGIQRELRRRIQEAFDTAGVGIPESARVPVQSDGTELAPPD
jgi:moderate conductance mechanosensitive channel